MINNHINKKNKKNTTDNIKNNMNEFTYKLVFENKLVGNYDKFKCSAMCKNKHGYSQCDKDILLGSYCKLCYNQTKRNPYRLPDYGRIDMPRTKYNYKTGKKRNISDWSGDASLEDNLKYNKCIKEFVDAFKLPEVKSIPIKDDNVEEDIVYDINELSFMKELNENKEKENEEDKENKEKEDKENKEDKEDTDFNKFVSDETAATATTPAEVEEDISEHLDDPYNLKKIIYQGVDYYLHKYKQIYDKRNMECVGELINDEIVFTEEYKEIHECYIIDEKQYDILYVNI